MAVVARKRVTAAAVFDLGSGSVGSTTTTRYLYPGYSDRLAEAFELGLRSPKTGTLKNLFIAHNDPKGNGNNITYTVRVAGVNSTIVAVVPSTTVNGSDTTNSVAVSAGDLVSIKVTKASVVGQSPRNVVATVELA